MKSLLLDRNLALEAVRVTEIAAIASSFHMGRGNEKDALAEGKEMNEDSSIKYYRDELHAWVPRPP